MRHLAEELTAGGHPVSAETVGKVLRANGFSLQGNAKQLEGGDHPDRDAQFGYLNEQAAAHARQGQPVISVDTKKKQLVGDYKNGGREWRPSGDPHQVKVHDFLDPALGKANPVRGVRRVHRHRLGSASAPLLADPGQTRLNSLQLAVPDG